MKTEIFGIKFDNLTMDEALERIKGFVVLPYSEFIIRAQKDEEFRNILRENSIDSKVPFNLSHRVAAARAGLGTYGKNCLLYAREAAERSSWITPIAIVVDEEFEPHSNAIYENPRWPEKPSVYVCMTSKYDKHAAPEGHENLFILIPVAPGLEDTHDIREKYLKTAWGKRYLKNRLRKYLTG